MQDGAPVALPEAALPGGISAAAVGVNGEGIGVGAQGPARALAQRPARLDPLRYMPDQCHIQRIQIAANRQPKARAGQAGTDAQMGAAVRAGLVAALDAEASVIAEDM